MSISDKPQRIITHGSSIRSIKDKIAKYGVTLGGICVFVALLLIFFYLLYVVKPIFDSATINELTQISYEDKNPAILVGGDENSEVFFRINNQGDASYYRFKKGKIEIIGADKLTASSLAVSNAVDFAEKQSFAIGYADGTAIIRDIKFTTTFTDNSRDITPTLGSPVGDEAFDVDTVPLEDLSFSSSETSVSFAYKANNVWTLNKFTGDKNMMTGETEWSPNKHVFSDITQNVQQVIITPDQNEIMFLEENKVYIYNISEPEAVVLHQVLDLSNNRSKVNKISIISGASSILVSYEDGIISQYFQVKGPKSRIYKEIRTFDGNKGIKGSNLASEFYRRSFATLADDGTTTIYYTTSQRELIQKKLSFTNPIVSGFGPRANSLIVDANGKLIIYKVDNQHPEVSWSALWNKVWYEGYPKPQYIWQSTSGTNDFEAKLSLMPLAFGTIKAAFYALLFAVPISIAGAIYTAYFMAPGIRRFVKPTVEIMEALPTVILGFLAGLWLAPLVEKNLPGIILSLVAVPIAILVTALIWYKSPKSLKKVLPDTIQEMILIPIIMFVVWLSFRLSPAIETLLFQGDTRTYITHVLGLSFDQRNALIVGIAMGFAVIPTIFSIAEDAIFSVPRHLSNGSLALGATNWQTLTKVVLLTASPGIFSAIMMGLGRAVGETMIVLMATGNTAIMEMSVFQGMRTLAANIAVEMPESAVGSSHYRVLFLAAFVLFIFTFFFNTIAEVVRQRLREKYSSL